MPVLTIITVCYNSEKHIERCLKSVLPVLQKLEGAVEYLIIDGTSKDNTLQIIKELVNGNNQVMVVSEPDHGIYDAMNKGIRMARGEYVYFVNSDDAVIPDGLIQMVTSLKDDKSYECLYGNVEVVEFTEVGEERRIKTWVGDRNLINLERGMICSHQAIICKRDTLLQYGGFYTGLRIAADWDLILRMYKGGVSFLYKNCCIAKFSRGGVSSSKQHEKERHLVRKRNHCYKHIDWEYIAAVKTEIYNAVYNKQR